MDRNQYKRALLWAGGFTGAWLVLIFGAVSPLAARRAAEVWPGYPVWPATALMWLVGCACALGLYEFFQIARRIADNRSFCLDNAASLRRVSCLAWAALLLLTARTVWIAVAAGTALPFALHWCVPALPAVVAAILTRTLAHLVERAARLQDESDLTI